MAIAPVLQCARLVLAAVVLGASMHAARADGPARVRSLLLANDWRVEWTAPGDPRVYVARVRFRQEDGSVFGASAHADGSTCYPEIRIHVRPDGFLFHGCTGVPKEMLYDPLDRAAPFKGRGFGFSYRWLPE